MNKYIIYTCNVCKRQREFQLDARRPDPVRCNITLHCRGQLSKTGERKTKSSLLTPIVAGLDDYIPRGQQKEVIQTPPPPNPISIFTGKSVISAAVFRREVDTITNRVTFWTYSSDHKRVNVETPVIFNAQYPMNAWVSLSLYEVTPMLLKFKKFVYNVSAGDQLIRGVDNSPTGKNLRFNQHNHIKIILNGVELTPEKYDHSINDQITMTPAITVPNSILEILVWDELPAYVPSEDLLELSFKPLGSSAADVDFRNNTCWGDYYSADFSRINDEYQEQRVLLYCFDMSDLDINKTYGIAKIEMVMANGTRLELLPSEFYIMLGKEPYLFQDKELNAYVWGSKFISQSTMLNFRQSISSGNYEIIVDQEIITQKYNPIDPASPVPHSEVLTQQTSDQQTIQPSAEDLKRKYILGPS